MKGDAIRISRVLAVRAAWAAVLAAILGFAFYLTGNFNGLSDSALGRALDISAFAAAAGAFLGGVSLLASLAGPLAGDRLSPRALLAAVAASAAGAVALAAAQFLRAAFGGLSV